MASIVAIFTSMHHTKQLNPLPNTSTNCVVNYSKLAACQGEREPFEDHPSTRGCLTSHNKSCLGNFQHQYLAELLVNIYSNPLMVKSLSCCCVHGRRLFSDPVTYINPDSQRLLTILFSGGSISTHCIKKMLSSDTQNA